MVRYEVCSSDDKSLLTSETTIDCMETYITYLQIHNRYEDHRSLSNGVCVILLKSGFTQTWVPIPLEDFEQEEILTTPRLPTEDNLKLTPPAGEQEEFSQSWVYITW